MIELRAQPCVGGMARLARRGKIEGRVARICCRLEVLEVARCTVGGQPLVLTDGRTFVARFALNRRMCSD